MLADKVKCLRTTTKTFQNGRYLCTWLSSGSIDTPGIWVDRYYYPDRISKNDALGTFPVYNPSFYDPIDSLSYPFRATSSYIFDKKSDLTIEPNTKYVYSRIGESDIQAAISSLTPIVSSFTQYYSINNVSIPYEANSITYDGQKYNKFDIKDNINCTSQFTISFDFYVDPIKAYGYSIANSNREFGILNDKKITPFVVLYQDNIIYIYNTDFNLIKTTLLSSKLGKIERLILKLNYRVKWERIHFFTNFDLKTSLKKIELHQYDYLSKQFKISKLSKSVFFVGQPLIFQKMMKKEIYVGLVNSIFNYYNNKNYECYYVPHRSTTLDYSPKNWLTKSFNKPLEYILFEEQIEKPLIFASFYFEVDALLSICFLVFILVVFVS
jgi:hypothetical protein